MSVGEDLAANLRNYKIQLQQVEAALLNDPSNDELIKLKEDLKKGIQLTKHLMSVEGLDVEDGSIIGKGSSTRNFQVGDMVLAPWSEDGQFYEAVVEDIMSDGQCNVMFNSLPSGQVKVIEVCLVSLLKPISGSKKRQKVKDTYSGSIHAKPQLNDSSSTQLNSKQRRLQVQKNREQVKKKQLKKQGRLKELEEEREREKFRWQQFNEKAMSKHLKGAFTLTKKQSIFKSPETVEGKVGVGTCGIAGKPMTGFVVADKYKRGTMGASSLAGIMDFGSKTGIPPGYK